MAGIIEKTVFQTADGKTFDSRDAAIHHENVTQAFNDAHEKYSCYGKFEFLDQEEFAEFVLKYADMIIGGSND